MSRRLASRRAVPAAAVLLASASLTAPASAKNAPPAAPAAGSAANAVISVDAVRDSVSVSGLPAGPAKIEVRRGGVLIGVFTDNAQAGQPLTVNTTAPSAAQPSGDCWERGALQPALTPDIRPLDVVSVVGGPSVTVPADAPTAVAGVVGGPFGGCSAISAFAYNAVQSSSPGSVISGSGANLVLSGAAQPLATAVSVVVGDGTSATAPVAATLTGTSWSATIPASALDGLKDGTLTATALFTVPDMGTGAASQIAGAPLSLTKGPAPAAPAGGAIQPAPSSQRPSAAPATPLRAARVVTRSRVALRAARRNGLRATFAVPAGARIARVELRRGGRTVVSRTITVRGGTRQSVRLSGARLRKGSYRLVIRVGSARSSLGPATVTLVRIV